MATAEETAIQHVVKTWYDGWNAQDMEVSAKVATEDMRFIRPSGNPASMAVFDAMSKSDDVTDSKTEILGFEKVHVGADSAMCCITHHDTFKYKGTQNDDVAVSTFYLTKVGCSWKIKWAQRSTGRAPTEPKPEDFDEENVYKKIFSRLKSRALLLLRRLFVILGAEDANSRQHLAAHLPLPLDLPQGLLWQQSDPKKVSPLVLEVHSAPPLDGLQAELLDVGPLAPAADPDALDQRLGLLGRPRVVVLLTPVRGGTVTRSAVPVAAARVALAPIHAPVGGGGALALGGRLPRGAPLPHALAHAVHATEALGLTVLARAGFLSPLPLRGELARLGAFAASRSDHSPHNAGLAVLAGEHRVVEDKATPEAAAQAVHGVVVRGVRREEPVPQVAQVAPELHIGKGVALVHRHPHREVDVVAVQRQVGVLVDVRQLRQHAVHHVVLVHELRALDLHLDGVVHAQGVVGVLRVPVLHRDTPVLQVPNQVRLHHARFLFDRSTLSFFARWAFYCRSRQKRKKKKKSPALLKNEVAAAKKTTSDWVPNGWSPRDSSPPAVGSCARSSRPSQALLPSARA
eukprot:CAMPEP_0197514134 /NCGR_PEP_ID=MMETSP1312-20131121/81098_1 /TAXON_ID=464262 /ORGANISM="Genus nov. species nov., Strain RCC2335" /LENGTH=572 /DNA_ID=CAMNT_0043062273 /DNA_START=259 /DNA_END=1980 /DNA_ORIENTATION=+